MATIVAAAGGGNWSAGGTWVGGVVPSASSDVQLDATSGNVTIDAASACRSLDCTGYTGTLTHNAFTLSLGDATAGLSNIALKLSAGMTYTPVSVANSTLSFISTSATQQTIDTGGKSIGNVTINGAGSSYILASTMTHFNGGCIVTLTAGTFNTGNFTCSWGLFASTNSNTRTLTLGSSSITLTGQSSGIAWDTQVITGLTFNAGTSTLTFTASGTGIRGGALTFNNLVATGSGTFATSTIGGASTFANFTRTGTANRADGLFLGQGFTVTGTLTITGNSSINRLFVNSTTPAVSRTLTAAAVSLTNVDFTDVMAAGAASPFTGTSIGNALGNTNITFDTPVTQTRTGAGGNWSTAANWTSRVPLPQDNVIVGAAASGTISVDMSRLGADVDFTGFAGTASFASTSNTMYGSLTLASGMTISGTQTLTLSARSSGKTITSNGKTFTQSVTISAPGAVYTLADAFVTQVTFSLNDGTLTTGNNSMQMATMSATAGTSRTLNAGTSTFTLTGTTAGSIWDLGVTGMTYNTSTATIVISGTTSNARTFSPRAASFGTLTYTVAGSTGSLTLNQAGTFGTINFSDASNARSLLLTAGTTTTVTNLNVLGTAGKLMTLSSATPSSVATISKSSGTVTLDYVSLQDITATGGAAFYGGSYSTNVSGNTGWFFQKRAAAGGGNWSSTGTWVGGVVPTAADSVVLDSSSGNVTIDVASVARSLDCTGYVGTLTHAAGIILTLGDATAGAGSIALKLAAGMTYTLGNQSTSQIVYSSTSATQQTITTSGKSTGSPTINGAGSSYILGDASTISSTATFTLTAGTFNTGNFACSWGFFASSNSNVRTLTLGSSVITMTGGSGSGWIMSTQTNLTVNAGTSAINFTAVNANFYVGSYTWYDVSFVLGGGVIVGGTPTFHNYVVTSNATKSFTHNLVITNMTVTGTFTMTGNSDVNRILLQSTILGTARTVTAASVSLTNTDFQDVTGAGAASPFTGTSLGNALGNTNITFDTPVTQTRTGAGGNWSTAANWTSRVPLPQDNVIVSSGASGTISADMPRLGADLNFTGFTGIVNFSSTFTQSIFGSYTLSSGGTFAQSAAGLSFQGRGTHTITSSGQSWSGSIHAINTPTGTYSLSDALVFPGLSSNSAFNITTGAFNTNNFNMSLPAFIAAAGTVVNLGTSTVSLTSTLVVTPLTISTSSIIAARATIALTGATATARSMGAGTGHIGTLTYTVAGSTGSLTLLGSSSFGTLNFSDASNARSLLFTAGTTTTITENFNVFGTAGKLMTIDSPTAATHTLNKLIGATSTDYLSIKNSVATGAPWYAGTHSTNVSGNTGWFFTAPPTAPTYDPYDITESSRSADVLGLGEISRTADPVGEVTETIVDKTITSTWNDLTIISKSTISQWNVLSIVSASSISSAWNLVAPVTVSTSSEWNALAILSKSTSSEWNLSAVLDKTTVSEWNALSAVSKSTTSEWNDEIIVLTQVDANSVSADWNVLTRVSVTSDSQWITTSIVTVSTDVLWNLASIVSTSKDAQWNLSAPVFSTTSSQWNVISVVSKSTSSEWTTEVTVSLSEDIEWNVRGVVSVASSTRWNVIDTVQIDRTTTSSWNVLSIITAEDQVGTEFDTVWKINSIVSTSVSSAWNQSAFINDTTDTSWKVLKIVSSSTESAWYALVSVDSSTDTEWFVLRAVTAAAVISCWNAELLEVPHVENGSLLINTTERTLSCNNTERTLTVETVDRVLSEV